MLDYIRIEGGRCLARATEEAEHVLRCLASAMDSAEQAAELSQTVERTCEEAVKAPDWTWVRAPRCAARRSAAQRGAAEAN